MENLKITIRQMLLDNQQLALKDSFIKRELIVERLPREATIITGIRRAGKSIYLRLYMQFLHAQGVPLENLCILDFADDRLFSLRNEEPTIIADVYYSLFPEKTEEKVYFFFDEIQYLYHWELFVNRLQTTRNCEVNITGSSAKLLVKEIATEFGGRSLSWELFPFSFAEFISTKQHLRKLPPLNRISSDDEKFCRQWFDEYMKVGGFPESISISDDRTRVQFLQNLAETVVFRDVIKRYNLGNPNEIWRLMQLLLNQMGGLTSFTKLKQRMAGERYRISVEMVKLATSYFEDTYLVYPIEIFSMNTAVRSTNPKKIYCVDHALAMSVAEKLTPDYGKILENIVFIHLRHVTDRIYYAKTSSGKEIDFVTAPVGASITEQTPLKLWQVYYEMEKNSTLNREITALTEAMLTYHITESCIITYNTERTIVKEGLSIQLIPVWKFLLTTPAV
ncbi:MAG: ATP-binding protein [Sphaerochaetaceae bacterium]|nr:ATP-binding protein [Sphaerochaetaceae bacterium]